MFDVIENKLRWLEDELSRLMEPHQLSLSQIQALLAEIREELVSTGRPGDFHQRCQEMGGIGDLLMAVNAIDLCRGSMAHEPGNSAIIIDQLCVAVRLSERFLNSNLQASVLPEVFEELLSESRKKKAQRAAIVRYADDPKQKEKQFIFECWKCWRANPYQYRSKARFAADMLDKCEHLESSKKIEDWCREWEKSEPC